MSVLQNLFKINEIPSLPTIVVQIRKVIESGSSDARELAGIIEHDPALAAKVLHTVNSAFFSPGKGRISSIQNAVVRLGFNTVERIALAIGLIKMFPQGSDALNHIMFWRHCVSAAYLAQEITRNATHPAAAKAGDLPFTCGLLHDLGIILYDQYLHEQFLEIVYHGRMRGIPFHLAEAEIAGNETHGFIGGALLELWKLESSVVSAVRFHHAPQKAPEAHRFISSVIHLTEYILCNTRIGSIEGKIDDDVSPLFSFVGIDASAKQQLLINVETSISRHSTTLAHVAAAPSSQTLLTV
ncbi:MAG: HDOD domain-containing protein [Chitinispirillaceae bacterium]|nr:HDOD domain-containing protein [Chitinispirillaceae bacterium]